MMKKYEKPTALVNNDLAEGVYMASGVEPGCFQVEATMSQSPELGRWNYVINVNGTHTENHTSDNQILTLYFNHPVTCSDQRCVNGSGTNTLEFLLNYHQNPTGNIGFSDIHVECDLSDLRITNSVMKCTGI